jgi:RimJ/RimL family protein N-acetyltransferase
MALADSTVVRQATLRDAKALVALARRVAAEPERWLVTEGEWRSVRDERRYLRAANQSQDAALFIAEVGELVAGRLSIARDAQPACDHIADLGLMVAIEHRRAGIGTALLEAAETWAARARVRKLELHVFPYNEAAIALYDRAGYRQVGLRLAHFRRGASYIDAILMEKQIA